MAQFIGFAIGALCCFGVALRGELLGALERGLGVGARAAWIERTLPVARPRT